MREKSIYVAAIVLGLVGYFLPWYNHDLAGLTLIGIDISEWLKFLPQYGSGELPNRDFFYIPPLFIGSVLILWAIDHIPADSRSGISWKRFSAMTIGSLITLLAFPSIDAVLNEAAPEWRPRMIAIILTLLICWGTLFLADPSRKIRLILSLIFAAIGLIFPLYATFAFRPVYIEWLQITPSLGFGFWLYGLSNVMIIALLLKRFFDI